LEYLQRNGLTEIIIVVEKLHSAKIERFLKEVFDNDVSLIIELAIMREEDDSSNALKLIKDKIKVQILFTSHNRKTS
jgi:NDP-sugar pyrophosphorylase family protein